MAHSVLPILILSVTVMYLYARDSSRHLMQITSTLKIFHVMH